MGETINIKEYIDILIRRKWIVIITILVCLAYGGYKTVRNYLSYVPSYSSNMTIRINSMKSVTKNDSSGEDDQDNNGTTTQELENFYNMYSGSAMMTNQNIATTYIGLATSNNVYKNIAAITGIKVSDIGFVSAVQSEDIPQFVNVSVTSSTPEKAKMVAEAFPEAYSNELQRIIGLDCVEVVYEATEGFLIPRATDKTIIKMFLVGCVAAVFLVLLVECLDTKVKTPEDIEKYWGVPLIGIVPLDDKKSVRHGSKK